MIKALTNGSLTKLTKRISKRWEGERLEVGDSQFVCTCRRAGTKKKKRVLWVLAFSKCLLVVGIRIYYMARNSIKAEGGREKKKQKSYKPSAGRRERKRKELYLSWWSNSSESPGAVNRRAMGFPRGHVNLLDFTTDRAPTQRYIYSVTSVWMDWGWTERGIAMGNNKEEESKLSRCKPKRCKGESPIAGNFVTILRFLLELKQQDM